MSWLILATRTGTTLVASCIPATTSVCGINVVDYDESRYASDARSWLVDHAEHWLDGLAAVYMATDDLGQALRETRSLHVCIQALQAKLSEWYHVEEHVSDPFAGAARPVGYPEHMEWPPKDKVAAAAALREPVDYKYYLDKQGIPVDHTGAEVGDMLMVDLSGLLVSLAKGSEPDLGALMLVEHEPTEAPSTEPAAVFPDDDTAVIEAPDASPSDQPE